MQWPPEKIEIYRIDPGAHRHNDMTAKDDLQERLLGIMSQLETLLPNEGRAVPWDSARAFRWHKSLLGGGQLRGVTHVSALRMNDLQCI